MNKKDINIVLALLLIGLGFYFFKLPKPAEVKPDVVFDPTNATYIIDGNPVTLVNGSAEVSAAPGSASTVKTMIFGRPMIGDLNKDGVQDAALLLVQDPGGSGTFYYIAAALNEGNVAKGTNAILLGDRIAPQTLELRNGQVIVNYAIRKPGEPMSTQPSQGVSKYFNVENGVLVEGKPIAGIGERCGGNMLNAPVCITGARCAPSAGSHLPFGDVGGVCVAN